MEEGYQISDIRYQKAKRRAYTEDTEKSKTVKAYKSKRVKEKRVCGVGA